MFKILTLNKISPVGLDNFDASKYVYGDSVEQADAIMVRSASMHEMEPDASVLAVARAGAGVNNIPVDKFTEKGICVFNTPGANANAVKEMVLCALLMSSRKVVNAIEWCKTLKNEGDQVGKLVEKGKSAFAGPEIKGKKLGVIGLGAIGILVANAAHSLGMEVYGYDPYLSVNAAWNLSRAVKHANSLSEIYESCDYITIHVPLTPSTKEMINNESIAQMKKNVRILNFARGDLVHSADVVTALGEGKIAAYVTDFPSADLIGVEGVIAIPHLGASTPESEENCAAMGANELVEYLENGNIVNSVNLPNVQVPRTSPTRLCIIHMNRPNMISAITSIVSKDGINIDNFQDNNRGDYAYGMLDLAGDIDSSVVKELEELEGVIRVRVIRR